MQIEIRNNVDRRDLLEMMLESVKRARASESKFIERHNKKMRWFSVIGVVGLLGAIRFLEIPGVLSNFIFAAFVVLFAVGSIGFIMACSEKNPVESYGLDSLRGEYLKTTNVEQLVEHVTSQRGRGFYEEYGSVRFRGFIRTAVQLKKIAFDDMDAVKKISFRRNQNSVSIYRRDPEFFGMSYDQMVFSGVNIGNRIEGTSVFELTSSELRFSPGYNALDVQE